MSVAIISYDTKFVENLIESLKGIKYEVFGDSLAFIKGFNDSINTVVYDASSGVFAEDDLRYLINKMKDKNLRYYVLTIPQNPIGKESLDGKIEFFNKERDLELLKEKLTDEKNTVENQLFGYKPQESDFEGKNTTIEKATTFDIEFNDLSLDYGLTETKVQPTEGKNIEDILESFDFQLMESKEESKVEKNIDLDSLIQEFESVYKDKEKEEIKTDSEFLQTEKVDQSLENFGEEIKNLGITEELMETKKTAFEKVSIDDILTSQEEDKVVINEGGKDMVANFNIQISSEDIKNVVLDIARNYLKNDPAINTIIDHLQIDFQNETMKELEDIKNQLKEKAREEAEKVLKEEITNLIKNELKEYVAEITAKIVKERLEQAFRSF
ncbi:hypothetical protein [Sulfurihydrogenibium sp.]|uniref:hypothetical protein n=1 Tax=Sulfurihydrogenibium sp. TaxID=2053621 RepID=UPI00262CEAB8|nr:hypothetical protein [Sulfurihydrogenibium sp.]